ncbi:MAG: VCBS repeat-containing protein [Flavobacteriaceae bacterium]|nr:VCBS repeat-containing protein [Flavobacteriaceae bacterium]
MNKYVWFLLPLFLMYSCKQKGEKELFELVPAEQSGLDFVNAVKDTDELSILDYLYFYNGGGVAVGDINADGLPDIYFTSNLGKNKLYLNKGNLKFEDITEKAGVEGNADWNTGTVMADVNGDGLLDIYVCAVVGLKGFDGHNELFINNGNNTFTESAKQYGLDFESYSSSAAFFDFDNDGDLDMYLLNHAVHSVNSFGPASIRDTRVYESGDKLMRNDNGLFVDISEQAGIYGGYNSYGLGLATADFNNDGFTDIYVCNDFHEDDYYYFNNGDGTFTESVKKYFGHTSRFSMGSDVADINNDGYMDLLSLDMLPEDEEVLKASDGDESIDILQLRTNQLGYHYQFTRNMLQINQQGNHFLENGTIQWSGGHRLELVSALCRLQPGW